MSNIQNNSAQKTSLLLKRQYFEELCVNKEMVILKKLEIFSIVYFDKKILLLSIFSLDSYLIIECIVR